MKMARADKDDFTRVLRVFQALDEWMVDGCLIDRRKLNQVYDGEEDLPELKLDPEQFLNYLHLLWRRASFSWQRFLWGAEMLFNNCIHPDADVIEWRPDVAARIEGTIPEQYERAKARLDAWRERELPDWSLVKFTSSGQEHCGYTQWFDYLPDGVIAVTVESGEFALVRMSTCERVDSLSQWPAWARRARLDFLNASREVRASTGKSIDQIVADVDAYLTSTEWTR